MHHFAGTAHDWLVSDSEKLFPFQRSIPKCKPRPQAMTSEPQPWNWIPKWGRWQNTVCITDLISVISAEQENVSITWLPLDYMYVECRNILIYGNLNVCIRMCLLDRNAISQMCTWRKGETWYYEEHGVTWWHHTNWAKVRYTTCLANWKISKRWKTKSAWDRYWPQGVRKKKLVRDHEWELACFRYGGYCAK